MSQLTNFIIAVIVLALGIPIGNYLAKITKEELRPGQLWFRLIIIFSILGAVISVFFGNDVLLFALLFIAVVTSRSLVQKPRKKRKND